MPAAIILPIDPTYRPSLKVGIVSHASQRLRPWWRRSDGAVRLEVEFLLLTVIAGLALLATGLYVQSIGGFNLAPQPMVGEAEANPQDEVPQVSEAAPNRNPGVRHALGALIAPVIERTGIFAPERSERLVPPRAELTVISPHEGAVIDSTTVTVTFRTTGIAFVPLSDGSGSEGRATETDRSGGGYLRLTLDVQPSVLWDRAEPYVFTNVPPGEHLLTVELLNSDFSPLSPPVLQDISFQTGGSPRLLPATGRSQALATSWALIPLVTVGLLMASVGLMLRRKHV